MQSDYMLIKRADRYQHYGTLPGMWWSEELRRWIITDAAIADSVMTNDAFRVHDYSSAPLIEKLQVDLSHLEELRKFLPLAFDGPAHKALRDRSARAISANTRPTLDILSADCTAMVAALSAPGRQRLCLIEAFLKPMVFRSVLNVAGISAPVGLPFDRIPQMFDDTVPVRIRRQLNDFVGGLLACMPADLPIEERYFRTAIVVLGVDPLLGSIGGSCFEVMSRQPGLKCNEMDWDNEMPITGVAAIERVAKTDESVDGHHIKAGDRIRLLLDAVGRNTDGQPRYSDIYFATGVHKCVGMALGRQAWKVFAAAMAQVAKRVTVIDAQFRNEDYTFNIYNKLELHLDD
jgi:cytochrome P450